MLKYICTINKKQFKKNTMEERFSQVAVLPKANLEAMAIATAINSQAGTFKVDMPMIELYDRPTSTLVTFKGRNAAGSADAVNNAYAFNVPHFNAADGLLPTYNDGFAGKNIDRHILTANGGRGLMVKSITFIATNAAGNQDASVLQALDFQIVSYTVKGGKVIPAPIDLSAAIRNTQTQSGTLTLDFPGGVWINATNQMNASIAAGATVTANVIWAK